MTDTELIDWLEEQLAERVYTGRCCFRWSANGRGWRLHESSRPGYNTVRAAIEAAAKEKRNTPELTAIGV